MNTSQVISLDIEETREEGAAIWDLAPWGHPVSLGVMPLFISVEDRLKPVGTAFTITDRVILAATAHHNIMAAVEHHRFYEDLRRKERFPKNYRLDDVGIYLMHQELGCSGDQLDFRLWPIERYAGVPPTDVGLCSLKLAPGASTLKPPISFAVPPQGERVRCIGYADFKYPAGGIPLDEVRRGTFDWLSDYSHRLVVVEGFVKQTFSREFSRSYLSGPCFAMSTEILPGQSGGPAFDSRGYVCGINSASATSFFNEPTSLISLLFPLLTTNVTFGADIGPVRINATQPFTEFIGRGSASTDGTERWVYFIEEDGEPRVGPIVPTERIASTHETFSHFNDGVESRRETGPGWVLRSRRPEGDEDN